MSGLGHVHRSEPLVFEGLDHLTEELLAEQPDSAFSLDSHLDAEYSAELSNDDQSIPDLDERMRRPLTSDLYALPSDADHEAPTVSRRLPVGLDPELGFSGTNSTELAVHSVQPSEPRSSYADAERQASPQLDPETLNYLNNHIHTYGAPQESSLSNNSNSLSVGARSASRDQLKLVSVGVAAFFFGLTAFLGLPLIFESKADEILTISFSGVHPKAIPESSKLTSFVQRCRGNLALTAHAGDVAQIRRLDVARARAQNVIGLLDHSGIQPESVELTFELHSPTSASIVELTCVQKTYESSE